MTLVSFALWVAHQHAQNTLLVRFLSTSGLWVVSRRLSMTCWLCISGDWHLWIELFEITFKVNKVNTTIILLKNGLSTHAVGQQLFKKHYLKWLNSAFFYLVARSQQSNLQWSIWVVDSSECYIWDLLRAHMCCHHYSFFLVSTRQPSTVHPLNNL